MVGRHNWHEMILYQFGSLNEVACSSAPDTCQAVNQVLPESVTCSRCEIKFVVLQPGGHLPPHSGPSNTRLRCFLGENLELINPWSSLVKEEPLACQITSRFNKKMDCFARQCFKFYFTKQSVFVEWPS